MSYSVVLDPFVTDIIDPSIALVFSFYGFIVAELVYTAGYEKKYLPNKNGLVAFLFFVCGYTGWILSKVFDFCVHESFFQWHAFWHFCMACATLSLFAMHRSQEQSRGKNQYERVDTDIEEELESLDDV